MTTTATGKALLLAKLHNKRHIIISNSTLNEKFVLNDTVTLGVNDSPVIQYIGFGRGSIKLVPAGNGDYTLTRYYHNVTDAALFNQFPVLARPLASDLLSGERARYRMRVVRTIGGTQYALYYLLKVDIATPTLEQDRVTVLNGIETARTGLTYSSANLTPTPHLLSNSVENNTTSNYIDTYINLPVALSSTDIAEMIAASNLVYGVRDINILDEIALVSGVERSLQGVGDGASITYNDVIGAQIVSFHYDYKSLESSADGYTITLNCNAVLPYRI